jgi:hypothetical protein
VAPAWLRPAILVLAGLLLAGLFSTEIDDSDFWWHLKTGEYILQHHALPVPDPFSYTTQVPSEAYAGEGIVRRFNLTHEWLAQVLWYGVYRAGGFAGLVLLKALLLAGACGVTGLLAARRSGSFYGGLAAAAAAASVAPWFAADRPALLTFLLAVVFLLILEERRRFWLLPPLALVWANCHGGFFIGLVVLGAHVAEALYLRWRKRPAPDDRRLYAVAALAAAATFFNPNHWRIFEVLLRYRESPITHSLVEWRPPGLWSQPYAFDILLYASAAVLFVARRKVRIADWLLYAAFAAAALAAFRNVMLFALFAPILIAAYFPVRRSWPQFTGYAALALLAASLGAGIARGRVFQLRVAGWSLPSGAANFIESRNIAGPIFNTYEQGGYLIWRLWPRRRVFIDGRALNEAVYQDYRRILYNIGDDGGEMRGPRMEALARYHIGAIVINGFFHTTGRIYPLAVALMNSPEGEWKLVYHDPAAMVFLRNPPPEIPAIPNTAVLDIMDNECLRHIERAPEECGCARTMAELYLNSGLIDRGRRMLGIYREHPHMPDPEIERVWRRLTLGR